MRGDAGMIRVREVWCVFGIATTAEMMRALRKLQGALMDTHIDADGMADRYRGVLCRVALPVGTKEEFEEMTGYRLTRLPESRR